MLAKNYIEVPQEGVRNHLIDEGNAITVYLDSHEEVIPSIMEESSKTVTVGYPIRCEKPVSRENFINAAEMQAYGIKDALASASFNASLARKWRENPGDQEVLEHDKFIAWVKEKLTEIGI